MTSILDTLNKTPIPFTVKGSVQESPLTERLGIQLPVFDEVESKRLLTISATQSAAETKIFFHKLIQTNSFSPSAVFSIFKLLVQSGKEEIAIACLPLLKNVNFQDKEGNSLLHFAVAQGQENLAYQLLKKNADPTLGNANKTNAFDDEFAPGGMIYELTARAIKECNEPLAVKLIELSSKIGHKFEANYCFSDGNTLLHLASVNALQDVAFSLLTQGADLMLPNKQGNLPIDKEDFQPQAIVYDLLTMAIEQGKQKIALDLLQLAKKNASSFQVDAKIGKNMTLLQLSIECSQEKVAYELLSMRAKFVGLFEKEVKAQTPFAYQLILLALQAGQDAQAVFLLTQFQKINPAFINGAVNESGQTLLHISSDLGNLTFTEKLLNAGASINAKDNEGWTALDILASKNEPELEIEEMLVKQGASSQVLSAKFLAHVWGIEGEGKLGSRTFEYEGCTLYPMSRQIAKYGIAFLKGSWLEELKASTPWLEHEDFSDVIQALDQLASNLGEDPDKLVKNPLIGLMTGWEEHATAVASNGKLFIKCDRAKDDPAQCGIQIFKMDNPKGLASAIQTLNVLDEDQKGENFFNSEINAVLNLQQLNVVQQKQQTAGNCTWASGQALILSLLTLHFSKSYELDEAVQRAQFVYKHWNISTKIESVKDYFTEVGIVDSSSPDSIKSNLDMHLLNTIFEKVADHQQEKPELWGFIGQKILSFVNEAFQEAGIDLNGDEEANE